MLHRKTRARGRFPPDEGTLPPLGHSPERVEPVKTGSGRFWYGHWTGFIYLLPFVVLFVLHEPLGMTDALLMGDRVSANYNLLTFGALILGSFAFVIHALSLPAGKGPGGNWFMPKLIFLVILWGSALLVTTYIRLLNP